MDAVHVVPRRHANVGEHHVGVEAADGVEQFGSGADGGDDRDLARLLKEATGPFAHEVVVLGDDDAQPLRHLADAPGESAVTDRYLAVAADDGPYRWANAAAAAGAGLGALGLYRLARGRHDHGRARLAAIGFAVAAGGWVVLAVLRVTVVTTRADDLAAGRPSGGGVADSALNGDGPFIAASLIAGAALVGLAVAWRRTGAVGWPTALLIGLAGATTALFVRGDPLAIVFIPPFPFLLAFLPLAIRTLRPTGSATTQAAVATSS